MRINNVSVGDIALHVTAAGSVLGTLIGWLPSIAAALAVVLYSLQILDSKQVRNFIYRWRQRRILKIQAKLIDLSTKQKLYPPVEDKKSGPSQG